VSALTFFVLGAVWYGLLGKAWLTALGKTESWTKQGSPLFAMLIAAGTALLMAFVMAYFLRLANPEDLRQGLGIGFLMWLGLSMGASAKHYAFSGLSLRLFLIDYGYDLLGMLVIAAILTSWR
jgi:hypothetical protein